MKYSKRQMANDEGKGRISGMTSEGRGGLHWSVTNSRNSSAINEHKYLANRELKSGAGSRK